MAFATVLAGASVALGAASAFTSASGAKSRAKFDRDVALNNEVIAKQNEQDTELRGRIATFDQRRAVARQISSVRSATAASGLVVDDAGTTGAAMVEDMTVAGELDVMRLRTNIDNEKRRAAIQGANFKAQAGQFEAQRSSINPFRSALVAGVGGAVNNSDILFGS